MAAATVPIAFTERANLSALGINPESIKFGDLTMESDSFICVREKQGDKTALTIVDMTAGNQIQRRPIAAEAAIMNPVSQTIALRAGTTLQIFDIAAKAKIKSYKLPEGTNIVFWRWVTLTTVAFVTQTSVFHWDSIDVNAEPEKMFDRHDSLGASQIINYRANSDGKWLLLIGIAQGANQSIDGFMQLYSVDKKVSQPLQGHAGCFSDIVLSGETATRNVFCFVEKKSGAGPKLFVMELGKDKDAPGGVFRIPPQDIPFPAEAASDFPVSLIPSRKHDILYLITKMGYLYLFDIHSGSVIFRNRISGDTIFVTCPALDDTAVVGVTAKKGQVLQISINEQVLVPYLLSLGGQERLALQLASRLNLPGADAMFINEFNRLFSAGDIAGAAKFAATSPQGALRNMETIQRFQAIPAQPGQTPPVLVYFSALLEKGKLNVIESIEIARPIIQQNRLPMIEKWLKEDKLECSEGLGDMIIQVDPKMALSIYAKANAHEKVISCLALTGSFQNIVAYAGKVGYRADYTSMLQNLVRQNPKAAEEFAKSLLVSETGPLIDINAAAEVFLQNNRIQEATGFLLEALKGNKKEEGYLQTRVLEVNLLGGAPTVAEAIFAAEVFSHYDRAHIGKLCEKCGLYQRALQHYTAIEDIERVIVYSQAMNPEFLVTFFGTLSADHCIECLNILLQQNLRANLQLVVQVATKYSEQLGPKNLINIFEKYKSYDGLYYYTGAILSFSQDKDVHFKYIESASKMGQFDMVIKVCKESTAYDPLEVKEFLINSKLADPRPLIHVCDRHGFVDEMTTYLHSNKLMKHLEVYVQKVSPQKTPAVVGRLLDLDCEEDFIKRLLDSVRNLCPVDPLVEEVEKRNRLHLLQPWLEQRVQEGNIEPATHNAIGKIYVSINRDPQQFLLNNQFYDSLVLGKYCENLDPYLAFLAYKRANGKCDQELLKLTNEHELFKDQARYLVQKQDMDLWASVLSQANPYRRRIIDETCQTALPETKNADEVGVTVRAFIAAELPNELIELLEKIVLHGTDFSKNRNLQNLLILTAINADKPRVMDYLHRLDSYDAPEIAKIAINDQNRMYEEGFEIYKKHNLNAEAIDVLLNNIESIERGAEFASRCNQPEVWSKLARAQLDANNVKDAIESYIKAKDASLYRNVIDAAKREESYNELIPYLEMARKTNKEALIDSELIFSFAKTERLADLQEFVASPNVAVIQDIGDRCFVEGLYDAAEILFKSINNNAKLAETYVKLLKYREAVECARKAGAIKTWKQVNAACVAAGEFRLAAICGLNIIKSPDHLEDLCTYYERRGHFDELINLFEQGLSLDGAHKGIYTYLGVLYSRHRSEKLMEHLKIYCSRMYFPKILRACEEGRHWKEAEFLYSENGEFDSAIKCMIDHPSTAWDNSKLLDVILKVRNQELYYKAIDFYFDYAPSKLNKLLQVLTPKVDHSRVVAQMRKKDQLALILPYLKSVQGENIAAVNEAYNDVKIEEEDIEGLRVSIDEHNNFDQVGLALRLEKHELLEFRRIAAILYKKNKRYAQSIQISKSDRMFKDVIQTASDSKDEEIVSDMLEFFVSAGDKECFCAGLYTCFELVSPDRALELAWRHNLMDMAMPFMIQYLRISHTKIKDLETKVDTLSKKGSDAAADEVGDGGAPGFMLNPLGQPLMLSNTAYYDPMQQQQQYYQQQPPMGYGMPPQPGMMMNGQPGMMMNGQPGMYQPGPGY